MIQVISLLGGRKTFRQLPRTPLDWIYLLRKGFPPAALTSFASHTGMTDAELAQMLGISVRALASRRSRKMPLSSGDSERLYRAARLIARANEVFGNFAKGVRWLREGKTPLFRGATPISLLDTEIGAEFVLDLLGRIEDGFFA